MVESKFSRLGVELDDDEDPELLDDELELLDDELELLDDELSYLMMSFLAQLSKTLLNKFFEPSGLVLVTSTCSNFTSIFL